MKRNTAGQFIGAQLVSATDGSAFTGTVTVYVTGDAGTQTIGSVGSGVCVSEGRGLHSYAPAQAETNFDHVAFTFTGTGAVPATVQVYPSFPQTGDSYAIVNSGTHGNAAIKGFVDDIGVAGAGLTALGDTRLANLDATISSRGTSTLTQTQVTGGAYTVQSSSCVLGDARIANLDAAVTTRMATYVQPTGFLAATFPGTVASTTNITAGTITTTTNLTNLPAVTANWLTAAGIADGAIDAAALSSDLDVYHADVQFTRDQTNTQDEYTVTWFSNGVRQTTVTSGTIQVIKRTDGTDLIASTAMTQIGSSGSWKYDATGAARLTVGEAALCVVTATISAGVRTFSRLVGRDST